MKALIQRVMNANVTVNGEVISSIERGICVLIGICSNDTKQDMEYMVNKLLNLKMFDDENSKRWKKSIVDEQYEILCVSQFTLYNTWKGNKPDFHHAMAGDKSKEFYENFIQMLRDKYKADKVKDGEFGAYMQVSIQNDGPVTFMVESPTTYQSKIKKGDRETSKELKEATD